MYNAGDKAIDDALIYLQCTDSDNYLLKEMILRYSRPLNKGEVTKGTWEFDVNMFSENDEKVYDMKSSSLKFFYVIKEIRFEDGDDLKLVEKEEIF